jgi:hypothetical protein
LVTNGGMRLKLQAGRQTARLIRLVRRRRASTLRVLLIYTDAAGKVTSATKDVRLKLSR